MLAQVKMATDSASCGRGIKIASITMYDECHAGGAILNGSIWVSGGIVEELVNCLVGGFRGSALFGGQCTECD